MIIQPLPTTRTFTGWAVGKYMPSPLLSNCINKLWSKYFVRLGKKTTLAKAHVGSILSLSQYGCSFQQGFPCDKSHYTIIRDSSQGLFVCLWRDYPGQFFLCTVCLSHYISCSSLLHSLPSQTFLIILCCKPSL